MLKDLIKLANHLDSKGLVKEADYLDRIIKSADVANIGSKALTAVGLISNPSECARLTARAMVTRTPEERINYNKCGRKDREFNASSKERAEIIVALEQMAGKDLENDVSAVLAKYISDLAKKGKLSAEVINPTGGIVSAILEETPAAIPINIVKSLIAGGANLAGQAFQKSEDRRQKIMDEAFRGSRTNQRGLNTSKG
tara:strand:- start:8126 stop:8722 length:597 start_codon:yes stop_codon:yes gene_type:complete